MNKRKYHQGCGVHVWLYINFLKIKILTLETLLLSRLTLYLCAEQNQYRALVLVSCLLLMGLLTGVEPITEKEREDNSYLWKC